MRTLTALAVVILCLALAPLGEAANKYVRPDGNDQYCTGATDAAWNTDPNHTSCAKKTIEGSGGYGGGDDVASSGDTIKVYSNTVEGVLYNEAPIITISNLTIEGYGGSGRPRIGKLEVFTSGWSNTTNDVYTRTYASDSNFPIWGAYLDLKYIGSPKNYEHERMTLAVHEDPNDLHADPNALDPNTCTTSGPAPTWYYIGPGFHYNRSTDVLSVRLKATPEFTLYGSKYLNLGLSDPNVNLHRILISSSEHSLRVEAADVTLKNLQLEAARGALILDGAHGLTVDNVVIWSGFAAAVLGRDTASDDVTIVNSSLLHDSPYWIAWSDCKSSSGPCENQDPNSGSGGMRDTMIDPYPNSEGWVIDHNLFRGGHDGIGTVDGNQDWTISYNVFTDFQDDPFEIEGVDVDRMDIYGNFITNSLNCLAVGQPVVDGNSSTTRIDGPVHYFSNICALARVPFVDRFRRNDGECCFGACKVTWNENRRYGNQHAFKIGPSVKEVHTHIYQNTVFLTDSDADEGMAVLGEDPNAMKGGQVFNNLFIKVNGRVGQADYETAITDKVIDWNLYWKLNSENDKLLANEDWVGDPNSDPNGSLCTRRAWECHSVGGDPNHPYVGTNPVFHDVRVDSSRFEGLGCFGQECDGIDESTEARWAIKPGSQFIEPELFMLMWDDSPNCYAGRGSDDPNWIADTGFPHEHVINPLADMDSNTIGAVPCNPVSAPLSAWQGLWNSFPFSQIWTTSAMASAEDPVAVITDPEENPLELMCPGSEPYVCGEKSDTDGGGPYTYLWQFISDEYTSCPPSKSVLCPGHVTFPGAGTCTIRLTVTDRWGKSDDDEVVVNIADECAQPQP